MGNNNTKGIGKYGVLLVLYCFLAFFTFSAGNSTMNVAVAMFEEKFGWSQTYLLSLQSIGAWVAIPFIFIFGQLYSKKKILLRVLIAISGLLYGLSIFLWGQVTNLAVFSLLFIICYVTYPLWGTLANNSLVNNWFPHKKVIIIGMTAIGLPFGSGMGSIIFTGLNKSFGFSNAYLIIGVIAALVCIFGFLVFTEYPEQRGCFPDNDSTMTSEQAQKELEEGRKALENSPWTLKRLITTKEVWLIGIANAYLFAIASGTLGTMIPRIMSIGKYTSDQALLFMLIAAFAACPGSFLCGFIGQKTSPKTGFIFTSSACVLACVLNVLPYTPCMILSLLLIGVGTGGSANFIMSMTSEYWGRYNFQKAYPVVLTINQIIGSGGPMFMVLLASKFGWNTSYIAMAVLGVIAIIVALPIRNGFVERAEAVYMAA